MATGDSAGKLFIWNNNADKTALVSNKDTGNYVRALAFSPIMTDRVLVSGHSSSPFNIKTWNPSTGDLIKTLSPAHTGNVMCLSFNAFGVLASGSADGSIKLWDTSRTNYKILIISGSLLRINSLAFSSTDLLAAGTSGSSPKVAVWYSSSTTTTTAITTTMTTTTTIFTTTATSNSNETTLITTTTSTTTTTIVTPSYLSTNGNIFLIKVAKLGLNF
jgi:WD40 repeat protein